MSELYLGDGILVSVIGKDIYITHKNNPTFYFNLILTPMMIKNLSGFIEDFKQAQARKEEKDA